MSASFELDNEEMDVLILALLASDSRLSQFPNRGDVLRTLATARYSCDPEHPGWDYDEWVESPLVLLTKRLGAT